MIVATINGRIADGWTKTRAHTGRRLYCPTNCWELDSAHEHDVQPIAVAIDDDDVVGGAIRCAQCRITIGYYGPDGRPV